MVIIQVGDGEGSLPSQSATLHLEGQNEDDDMDTLGDAFFGDVSKVPVVSHSRPFGI